MLDPSVNAIPKEFIVNTDVFIRWPFLRDLVPLTRWPHVIRETRSFLLDDGGATMVEYAFMVMLIAIVCFAAIASIGTKLNGIYNSVANDF
jgi:Flp pilus assembly pilin Flp